VGDGDVLALRMRMSSRLTCTQWTARKSASKTSHCCRYLMGLTPKGCTSIRSQPIFSR